ncbi:MAG: hypothetical protein RL557_18 [archaeon]|jgi:hypothetical protein
MLGRGIFKMFKKYGGTQYRIEMYGRIRDGYQNYQKQSEIQKEDKRLKIRGLEKTFRGVDK